MKLQLISFSTVTLGKKINLQNGPKCSAVLRKVKRKLHIVNWLPKYDRAIGIADIIAGITLGLTIIPQSIAYASLAGLTAQYGLYSAFIGSFVYVLFGTVREVSIGPTSLMALASLEYTRGMPVEFIVLLAFLAGCVELLMGLLNLGFMVDFIGMPVVSGFTSGMSVLIIISQLKSFFGLKFKGHGSMEFFNHLGGIKLGDTILGISCVAFLLLLRKLNDVKIGGPVLKRTLWYISISRNALIVIITAICAFVWERTTGSTPFALSGKVLGGLPTFEPPMFSSEHGNTTYTFLDMCGHLGSGIVVIPVLAVIANVAIAKAFAVGVIVDASQEMFTLGLCNILGSFVQSMPVCGAFTRSAVSHSSGVRTPLSGIYSAIMVLLALSFLTPYFYYIPRATLAAVLISAVLFMIDFGVVARMWKVNRNDGVIAAATMIACMANGMEFGVITGVVLSLIQLLYYWARPKLGVVRKIAPDGTEYQIVTPSIGFYFPSVEYLRNQVSRIALKNLCPLVLDCSKMHGLDYTTMKGIESLILDFEKRDQTLLFLNMDPSVYDMVSHMKKLRHCTSEEEVIERLCGVKIDELQNFKQKVIEQAERLELEQKLNDLSCNSMSVVIDNLDEDKSQTESLLSEVTTQNDDLQCDSNSCNKEIKN